MPQNCSFYIADPSMIGSRLFDKLPDIISYEGLSEGDKATGFRLVTEWGSIQLNMMPDEQTEGHLNGFAGYMHSHAENDDDRIYMMARLNYVCMVLGCIIEHEEADEEKVQQFLFQFNAALNSLMFLYDSVWDWTSEALCGPHKTR